MDYSKHYNTKVTPQSQPVPGKNMVANSAGGFSFLVDDWKRLDRFLILGTEGGTYYIDEHKLTVDNANAVKRCITADGKRTVKRIVEVSDSGLAAKNDPALFALAMCASFGNVEVRREALQALPKVARIGTHLFHFAQYINGFRGWGRGLRNAVAKWYLTKTVPNVAFQAIKYQQRDGWSHRDLLRLSHPNTDDIDLNLLFKWIVDENVEVPNTKEFALVRAFEAAKTASEKELIGLIKEYNMPMEAIPTDKRTQAVWAAMLPNLGMTALIRNLGNLSKQGILVDGSWDTIKYVTDTITNPDFIRKARIHPIAVLAAVQTYAQGHGFKGSSSWPVVSDVVDALENAFHAAFQNVEPTNKRLMLAIDVSGSMAWSGCVGLPTVTPAMGAAAMAMVTYKVEPNVMLRAFSDDFRTLDLSRKSTLKSVMNYMYNNTFGGTDVSLPMVWATTNKIAIDAFVVYTDNQTWAGRIHPFQALQAYRKSMNIPAKLIVVGMQANQFTVADPNDAGMMDVVGFDASAPVVMSQFIAQ